MEIKKISTVQHSSLWFSPRPRAFGDFIGQEEIKKILKSAMESARKREEHIGHLLFSGPSGYGKTSLAHLIAHEMNVNMKVITGYAISKPSDLVSLLNSLETNDILFIDEIHRLKPTLEEILYVAMEDRCIDMVLPEGGNLRIPLNPFTLIGATTKMESLSTPLKNRFVYKFHFMDYTAEEIKTIITRYLKLYQITPGWNIIDAIATKVESTPREIHNFCVKIRDFLVANGQKVNNLKMNEAMRRTFDERASIDDGWLTPLHKKYLAILDQHDNPVGIKTLSVKLGINEKSIENDIEWLLFKLGKIEKTARGRVKMK